MQSSTEIPKKPYYVTMTDKFMSRWGIAQGRINKFVIGCDTFEQADRIAFLARNRDEMKYVNITSRKPYYDRRNVLVSYKDHTQIMWSFN